MNLLLCLPLIISLLAPVPANKSGATKNRKSQVGKQSTSKRTVKRRRGNIKRTNRRRHNQKYELKRRRKAGGTYNRRPKKSRATKNTNRQVNKRTTNRERTPHVQNPTKQGSKDTTRKASPQSRPSGRLSPLQREVLRYQMQILLSDPQMGPIYRQILRRSKKKK